jgi:all-trans-8'-apo-beta-carotenal 15,15'-oxygenase
LYFNTLMIPKGMFGRRQFVKTVGKLGLLSLYPMEYLLASENQPTSVNRLSWLSNRGVSFEGSWIPRKIEGEIPSWFEGCLYRNGPGSKEVYGKKLNHFFDGDGYLTAFRFGKGRVSIQSRFIETKERVNERKSQKMLYHDFGTACDGIPHGYKNPPNIHIFPFSDRLLALSEASHPTQINKENLEAMGLCDFGGDLPKNTTFTAHPKIDPKTGNIFAFGITRSMKPKLRVLKVDGLTLKTTEIAAISLGGFYPIHDMMMTQNYLIFTVSPVKINLFRAATMRGPISEAIEYDQTKPLRIIIVSKNVNSSPIEIESYPSGLIFHHVNAFEDPKTQKLIFDSFVIEDGSAYEVFKSWAAPEMSIAPKTRITRFEIDLNKSTLSLREPFTNGITTDFPCIDQRLIGQRLKFFYALESDIDDPLAFNVLTRWNMEEASALRVKAKEHQVFGEAVFVPNKNGDLLLHLGYDAKARESFLDLRNPSTLELISRVWIGRYIPLGFHGSFII